MATEKYKGITIEIDANTDGVTESLKDINKQLNSTQGELKKVDKALKDDAGNTTLLAQKQQILTNAIDETTSKLVRLARYKAEADNSDDVDKNTKEYRDLTLEIEKTKKALEKLNDEYKNNENAMNGVSSDMNDIAKSMDEAGQSGLEFGDILKANVLGSLIIDGIKALANAFVDLGKSMYNALRESGAFADDINTMAKQYNLSTKELQGFYRASELIDVSIETVAKSMNKLTKNMTSSSSSVVGAFQELGIATRDTNGELRSSNDVFYETLEALALIQNETEQDSLAMEIFGKSASDLGPLINGGVKELNKLNQALEENSLILSQDELDALNKFNDSFDLLGTSFSAFKDKMNSELAPAIQPILDNLTENLNAITPMIEDVVDKIIEFITEHQEELNEFIDNFFTWITSQETQDFFDLLIDLIVDKIPQLISNLNILKISLEDITGVLNVMLAVAIAVVDMLNKILSFDIDGLFTNNSAWQSFQKYGGGSVSSMGFGEAVSKLSSQGFSSGGIVLNNTINVNNNGNNITANQVNEWADIMTNRINDNLGRLI